MANKGTMFQVLDKCLTVVNVCACLILGYFVQTTHGAAKCADESYNGTSYTFCYDSKPREDAQLECQNYSMQLAVISTLEEYSYWRDYFKTNYPKNEIWVGATFSIELKAFVWDTGGEVPTDYFGSSGLNVTNLTNGTCLRIFTNQWLLPLTCGKSRGSLCQYISVTTTSATTKEESVFTDVSSTQSSTENGETITETVMESTTHDVPAFVDNNTFETTESYLQLVTSNSTESAITTIDLSPSPSINATIIFTDDNVSNNGYLCACAHVVHFPSNYTIWLNATLQRIKDDLFMNYKILSATVRRKTSSADTRPSSQGIGCTGILIVLAIMVTIVVLDVTTACLCTDSVYRCRHSRRRHEYKY